MIGNLSDIAFVSMPGSGEWMVLLFIGLLIFGRRLPEVARSLGKSVNEFKKGLRDFQDSADEVTRDVGKVTDEVASEAKTAAGVGEPDPYQSTTTDSYQPYEGDPQSNDAYQADSQQTEPNPTGSEPGDAQQTDSPPQEPSPADSSQADPKRTDSPDSYEPMA
ncbi:MAG: hypothetical protein A2Y76_10030 [Planctomycetes bacterium RBG_13_60_9]|nr:MAG: hypothetical protein A2Y76_10030 [Planctomycetes bacterium RBG_13_60_9]